MEQHYTPMGDPWATHERPMGDPLAARWPVPQIRRRLVGDPRATDGRPMTYEPVMQALWRIIGDP